MDAQQKTERSGTRSNVLVWVGLATVAAGIFVFTTFVQPYLQTNEGTLHPAVGSRLPQIELQGLTGGAADISAADLAGKVVLLDFWGTWCPPCRLEMPELVKLAKQQQDADFRLVAVSCGPGVDPEIESLREPTEAYLGSNGFDIPCYVDRNAATRRAVMIVGGDMAYPTTIVLDRGGVIRGFWQGYSPAAVDEIQRTIEHILVNKGGP